MAVSDIAAAVEIDRSSNRTAWKAADFARELTLAFSSSWVAEGASGVIGFAVMWTVQDEAQVLQWAVAPEHRCRGVGSALMQKLLDEAARAGCKRVDLEFLEGNAAAEALYRKFGFYKVGLREKFYQAENPGGLEGNAILMRRDL